MQDELRETHFGALVVGTGLTQSIVAAALSAASQPIIHIDEHAAYGGPHASLSLNELKEWAEKHAERANIDEGLVLRKYTLSLVPQLVPATGPFVAALVNSGVARYGSFVMPKRVVVATPTDTPDLAQDGGAGGAEPGYQFRTVPANKQDVFRDKSVSLVQKRRLIKFLVFASGEFEGSEEVRGKESVPLVEFLQSAFQLEPVLADALAYATAFCANSNDPTLPALKRTRAYLRSVGRYGPSPFLIGHFGGAGELAQGFCRTCAVGGGTYVLGRKVLSIVRSDGVEAETMPETQTASTEEREQTHRERTTSTGITVQTYHPPATFEGYGVEGLAAPSTDQSAAEATEPNEPASTSEQPTSEPPEPVQPTPTGPLFRIQLEDFASPFTASTLVGPQHWLARVLDGVEQPVKPTHTVRAVLVIDSIALDAEGELDETLVVFPPKEHGAAVTVLGHGSSTMSCPDGKCILYFTTQTPTLDESPKAHLQPYVDAVVRGGKVWAEVFWRENEAERVVVRKAAQDQPFVPEEQEYTTMHLTEGADAAAREAEHVFWQVLGETPGEDGKGSSGVEFFARVGRQEDMDDFD